MNTIKRIPSAIAAAYRAFIATMRTVVGGVLARLLAASN